MRAPDPGDVRWLGLDGARGGWAAAALTDDGAGELRLLPTLEEAFLRWPGVKRVLVDMPVGLPGVGGTRRCDGLARRLLPGRRASSVFSPPCRRALSAGDHAAASRVNREVTGRGLSIQAWHLAPRIREVEACLRVTPRRMHVVVEAHPELAFHLLAGRSGRERRPLAPKRSAEGRRQRRDVLECILPSAPALLDAVAIPRREASPDDWVDALVLACVLYRDGGAITLLPDPPERDETGLPMAIAVPVSPAGGVEAGNL